MSKTTGTDELGQFRPFDTADLEELKTLLGVGPLGAAIAAQLIHEVSLRMRLAWELDNPASGKSGIKAIGQLAGHLGHSANLLGGLGEGHPLMSGLRESGMTTEAISSFIEGLRVVGKVAGELADDPAGFRRAQGRLDRSRNALSLEGQILWPVLLRVWMRVHGNLGLSQGGPLMRFIELAHRHAGVTREPKYETVRSARKRHELAIEAALELEDRTPPPDVSPSTMEMARALLALEKIYHPSG